MRVRIVVVFLALAIYFCLVLFALFNYGSRVQTTMPDVFIGADFGSIITHEERNASVHGYCKLKWSDFGIHGVDMLEKVQMEQVIADNLEVNKGGTWAPSDCHSVQRVAIIIPYRKRWFHLKMLLKHLHPMLRKQKLDYRIFLIEQMGETSFNRALLMNIGFIESMKYGFFDCFVFHDVDLMPEHDGNIYLCDKNLRHLAGAIDEMRYHVIYYNYAGGVSALSRQNFIKINGFANSYWGWGNEDDDFSARTKAAGLKLTRPPDYIGRYKMARHVKAGRGETGNQYFNKWRGRWYKDGINSLSSTKYKVISSREQPLYTNITVDVGHVKNHIESDTQESLWWFLSFYFP